MQIISNVHSLKSTPPTLPSKTLVVILVDQLLYMEYEGTGHPLFLAKQSFCVKVQVYYNAICNNWVIRKKVVKYISILEVNTGYKVKM